MFSLRKLAAYAWGTVVHPRRTFEEIARESSLAYSVSAMVAFGLLYSALALLIYAQGHRPSLPILISVAPERFYLVEAVYLLPLTLQLWILFSALCHLFAGPTRGSFNAALSVLGFANAVPGIAAFWLPDFVSSVVLGTILTVPMAVYGSVWFVWLVWLSGIGLKATHGVAVSRGALVALAAFLVHVSIGVFFIR